MSHFTLEQIEELLKGTTEGEWKISPLRWFVYVGKYEGHGDSVAECDNKSDTEFIAASKQIVEQLLATNKDLLERVKELSEQVSRLENCQSLEEWQAFREINSTKVKELEEKLSQMQIDHSRGSYTPFHETERRFLAAENKKLLERIKHLEESEILLMKGDRLTFKCKCGSEIETSPIPMYEEIIKKLENKVDRLNGASLQRPEESK